MKFQTATLTFTKTIEVEVVFPVSMKLAEIESLAAKADVDSWDQPIWENMFSDVRTIEVPFEECQVVSGGRYGFMRPVSGYFDHPDLMVPSDSNQELVVAEDAKWWIATEEAQAAERRREHNPAQLDLFASGS